MESAQAAERVNGIDKISCRAFPQDDRKERRFTGGIADIRRIPGFEIEARLAHVKFPIGVRTAWHYHRGLQVLWFLHGNGEVEDETRCIPCAAGDIIRILPYVRHRHGATAEHATSHLAITSGDTCWEADEHDDCWEAEKQLIFGVSPEGSE